MRLLLKIFLAIIILGFCMLGIVYFIILFFEPKKDDGSINYNLAMFIAQCITAIIPIVVTLINVDRTKKDVSKANSSALSLTKENNGNKVLCKEDLKRNVLLFISSQFSADTDSIVKRFYSQKDEVIEAIQELYEEKKIKKYDLFKNKKNPSWIVK